ncbi:MAG: hypothetical protein HYS27_18580 [Deltaproteobacteria bacterium]|nr:hypothetical protein [Deltaproteobacteria bacterium]
MQGEKEPDVVSVVGDDEMSRKAMARRWADRIVRVYAAAALQVAGFATAAGALASAPEIVDDDTSDEAKHRVHAALGTVLAAREIPKSEGALVAVYAAREALLLSNKSDPSERELFRLVDAMHVAADVSRI